MASRITLLLAAVLVAAMVECKIVLPHKLRYLENMLNADLIAKATRMQKRLDGNPSIPDGDKDWLSKYQDPKANSVQPLPPLLLNSFYQKRNQNGQY